MNVSPRQRYTLTALLLTALVLLVILVVLVSTPSRHSALLSDSAMWQMQPSRDMRALIGDLFTPERFSITYSRSVEEGNDGILRLIERSRFELNNTPYVAELISTKGDPNDETYSVIQSLTLALAALNDNGARDEIVFVDTYADGMLDAVYMNGVELTSPDIMIEAQTKYTTELMTIGESLSF